MKNLRTNSKEVKTKVKAYILETVYNEHEEVYATFEEAATELHKEFKRVDNFTNNLNRKPNNVNRFLDYLQGLPFWFTAYNCEIIDFLNSLGINNDKKEYHTQKSWELYALLIYREIEKF